MNSSERKILRNRMPWLKRSRPPLVFFVQIALSMTLLAVMAAAFYRARSVSLDSIPSDGDIPASVESRVAFVQLPPFVEQVAMQSLRTFLSTFRHGGTNDIDFADFNEELPPFAFSTPQIRFGKNFTVPLPVYAADEVPVRPLFKFQDFSPRPFLPVQSGVFAILDESLKNAEFKFDIPSREQYRVASGEAVFYVDWIDNAEPEVYVLSPVSPDTRMIESVLLRSSALRPCRGKVVVMWL